MKKRVYILLALIMVLLCSASTIQVFAAGDEGERKVSISEERKKWENNKVVYLTFDDGPTATTLEMLKILKAEDVKATFFVIGELVEQNPEILKAVQEDGHEICIHTYSHESSIYTSKERYLKDYEKAVEAVKNVIDEEPSSFMRMPGGSSTTMGCKSVMKAIRNELNNRGVYYVDWNISLEDAIYPHTPVEKLLSTFRRELKKTYIDPNTAIVLMHDGMSNNTTPKALPSVIKYFKENGYEFKNFGEVSDSDIERLMHQRHINKYSETPQKDNDKEIYNNME